MIKYNTVRSTLDAAKELKGTQKPKHPGEVLLKAFLEPSGVTPAQFSVHLGHENMSVIFNIIAGRRGIGEGMAWAIADATGTTPQFWTSLQNNMVLYNAKHSKRKIKKLRGLKVDKDYIV